MKSSECIIGKNYYVSNVSSGSAYDNKEAGNHLFLGTYIGNKTFRIGESEVFFEFAIEVEQSEKKLRTWFVIGCGLGDIAASFYTEAEANEFTKSEGNSWDSFEVISIEKYL